MGPELGARGQSGGQSKKPLAGLLPMRPALVETRPFRSPHHTISDACLIGGGNVPPW